MVNELADVITQAQNGTLSDEKIKDLVANKAEFVESADVFGGSEAAAAVSKMIDNYAKAMATNDTGLKATLQNDAKTNAQKIKVDALAKIDPSSISQMKDAIKTGNLQQSVVNKNYGAALDKVIYKAMDKALQHTQNVKNDPKTENIIPQLLRELLAETKKKK